MFTFATAASIRFGVGISSQLDELLSGRHPFVLTGSTPGRHSAHAALADAPTHRVAGEPTFEEARAAVAACRASGADTVVGIGGGAVIALAKAVSVLAAQPGDPLDYAEVIGAGRALGPQKLRMIAVPTTAGTGSEVTANAVLSSAEHAVKVSLRGPAMLPDVALVDPALTVSAPPSVTASSGMDALTQCIEPYTTPFANPLTDGFAREGMRRARSLTRAFTHPDDLDARTDMSLCSLLGGLSLANSKLGAVHGFAGVIGGVTGAPHGAICAALLAPVTTVNLMAMFDREPDNPAIERYREAGGILTGAPHTSALQEWLRELVRHLALRDLRTLGLQEDRWDEVATKAAAASSMKGNPIVLTHEELLGVLEAAS